MRVTSCRLLLLPLLSLLGGCFLLHDSDDEPTDDPVTADGGPSIIDADLVIDAGPPPAVDGGPTGCRPVEAIVQACVEGDPAADFAPGFLVQFPDCHCNGTPRCEVDTSTGVAQVEVSICDEGLCRACTGPNEVWCSLPDFETRTVVDDGVPLFELGLPPGDGQLCQSVGSRGGGLCEFPGRPWADAEHVCVPDLHLESGMRVPLSIVGEVSCVFEPGPCEAELDDVTRTIDLRPNLRSCDEGTPTWGCSGSSGRLEQTCWTPELRDGTYTLQMDGRVLGELAVGAETPAGCIDL